MGLNEIFQGLNNEDAAVLNQPGAPGVGRFFTDDVDLLPPGPDNVKGAVAAADFWAGATQHFKNVRLTTVDAVALGDEAVREIGTYWGASRSGGEPISGKYLFIWRQVGPDWKIATDIWTSHSGHT